MASEVYEGQDYIQIILTKLRSKNQYVRDATAAVFDGSMIPVERFVGFFESLQLLLQDVDQGVSDSAAIVLGKLIVPQAHVTMFFQYFQPLLHRRDSNSAQRILNTCILGEQQFLTLLELIKPFRDHQDSAKQFQALGVLNYRYIPEACVLPLLNFLQPLRDIHTELELSYFLLEVLGHFVISEKHRAALVDFIRPCLSNRDLGINSRAFRVLRKNTAADQRYIVLLEHVKWLLNSNDEDIRYAAVGMIEGMQIPPSRQKIF